MRALLRYIDRDEIKILSGASMGIFSAYAVSTDKLDVLEYMYRDIDISKKHELLKEMIFKHMLSNYLHGFISSGDRLEIPCCFPVTYIPLFSVRYYWIYRDYNPIWHKYIKAGTNFPFLSVFPSFLEKRMAIDGGAVDNIPLFPVLKSCQHFLKSGDKLDLIIVLHFDARYDYRKEFSVNVPVLECDVAICNGFKKNHLDFSSSYVDEMIRYGEEYGEKICKRLFSGDCSEESLRKAIDGIFLEEHTIRQSHTSVDGLVSTLNVVGKALRSDSICSKNLF